MGVKIYRAMQRAQIKMLREYFSGVPFESLTKRYGYSEKKIKELASNYKQENNDMFDNPDNRRINLSLMTHKEEV